MRKTNILLIEIVKYYIYFNGLWFIYVYGQTHSTLPYGIGFGSM